MKLTAQELRKKFLGFFERHDHAVILSASLVPSTEEQLEGKEKVLFTSAGMQPLIPYLLGKPHPKGRRLADVQKCLRTDDIEEVGDAIHHTFFEMLGNWSLGDYWKKEAVEMSFEFLTRELSIPIERLAVTVFAGDEDAPRDEESARVWKSLGIPEEKIFYFGKKQNWWPSGEQSGPCGPDTEIFYWTGEDTPEGQPNINPLWVEIWNDVFMEFNRKSDGSLEPLSQQNVDTGMGFERMLAVLQGKNNNYETDLFFPLIKEIKESRNQYSLRSERIIADHLRAAVFLVADGVKPVSRDDRGSVLVRLITNAMTQEGKMLEVEVLKRIIGSTIMNYQDQYPELSLKSTLIYQEIEGAVAPIYQRLRGKEIERMQEEFKRELESGKNKPLISLKLGQIAFNYQQSYGIPGNASLAIAEQLDIDREQLQKGYEEAFREHQQRSKAASMGIYKGGLAGHSEIEIKYHTATHLLHQALRDVLGPQVFQKGSNINQERLRFDFSFDQKMTDEEVSQVEKIVNKRIEENLVVDHMIVPAEQARKLNAIGLFGEKYGHEVSVYAVGPNFKLDPQAKDQRERGGYYSVEFCGGPHVNTTREIGKMKITKEEAVSAGVRRIRAQLV